MGPDIRPATISIAAIPAGNLAMEGILGTKGATTMGACKIAGLHRCHVALFDRLLINRRASNKTGQITNRAVREAVNGKS